MISHEHKCIFIHQRKCAGVAIMKAFGVEPDNQLTHFLNEGVLSPEYSWHSVVMPNYYKFSIVRNPWDRFVSGWLYCENTKHLPIKSVLHDMLGYVGHDYVHITRPQWTILYDAVGVPITNYLMRFEHLQSDFDHVCDVIGKPRVELTLANHNPCRLPYQEYFQDAETLELFQQHFKRDIEAFGYSFDGE